MAITERLRPATQWDVARERFKKSGWVSIRGGADYERIARQLAEQVRLPKEEIRWRRDPDNDIPQVRIFYRGSFDTNKEAAKFLLKPTEGGGKK